MRRREKLEAIERATKMVNKIYLNEGLPMVTQDDGLEHSNYIDFDKFLEITKGATMRPRIYCRDGFSFSVQAGPGHYSQPKDTDGPYEQMEVGLPSEGDDLLIPFIEVGSSNPTMSSFPYTPVEVISKLVDKHGGIDVAKTRDTHQTKLSNVASRFRQRRP